MEPIEDYSFPPASFKPLLTEISGLLGSTSSTLAVAETTTGGLVSAALLSVSGASKFFVGGATLYSIKSRKTWAGWTDENVVGYKYVYCGVLLLWAQLLIRSPAQGTHTGARHRPRGERQGADGYYILYRRVGCYRSYRRKTDVRPGVGLGIPPLADSRH
jgi:hypothetical protein